MHIVKLECLRNRLRVSDVCADERPPTHEALMPSGEIVKHHREIASPAQCLTAMRADVARAAGYEDRRHRRLRRPVRVRAAFPMSRVSLKYSLSDHPLKIRNRLRQTLGQRNAGSP